MLVKGATAHIVRKVPGIYFVIGGYYDSGRMGLIIVYKLFYIVLFKHDHPSNCFHSLTNLYIFMECTVLFNS